MELKPCPFCGCKEIKINFPKKKTIEIKCPSCLIKYIQSYLRFTEEQLLGLMIKSWNSRVKLEKNKKGEG